MSAAPSEVLVSSADSLEPTADVLKLSATRIATFLRCPRQYRFRYLDKVPTVLTGALAFGRVIHQVIHDLHQWSIYSGEPLNEQVAISNFARLWEGVITREAPVLKDIAEIAAYARLAELILMGYVEANREKAQPLVMEFPFEIEMYDEHTGHGYVLCGVIDRIDQEKDGLVVVDYKTGKRKPSLRDLASDVQLSAYAFAASEVFGQEVKELVLYHLRDQTPLTVKRTTEQIRQLTNVILPHVARGVLDQRFAPDPGYYCRFCEFRERCLAEGPDEKP
jgi:putative RecB family exonuclease